MRNKPGSMGIYVHIPFCLHKCYYCDFYSLPLINPKLYEEYTRCLILELSRRTSEFPFPFTSIYFGGGTPSLMEFGQIARIIEAIYKNYQPASEVEVSIEVNPATVTRQDLIEYRRAGINRLSIGIQSFADEELKLLGRMHNAGQAIECLEWAGQTGYDNINVDLIYGLPGQSQDDWLSNLRKAAIYYPQHVSAYLLQLEPTTPLALKIAAGELTALDDGTESDFYYLTRDFLHNQGYQHYEISNFALAGYQCRHNLIYWNVGSYLGIGVGAVSFDGRQRSLNSPPLEAYMSSIFDEDLNRRSVLEILDSGQKMAEAVVMGLRLTKGINRDEFKRRFGVDLLVGYKRIIDNFQSQGLLKVDSNIYLTPRAYFISNQVLSQFVS